MDLVSHARPFQEDLCGLDTLFNVHSPYTKTPVSIQFGAEETAYLVPPHFLPAEWLESGVRERLGFPGIDAHTGHTIVHYLYKGSYETPRTSNSVPRSKNSGLRAALWVFIATSNHGLYDLQQLATQEIEKHGSSLSLTKLLETIDDTFAFLDPHSWVHEYLRRKARVAFEQDHTVFSDTAFLQSLGNLALIKFMARCVVDLYSTKIARMMDREQSVGQSETPKDREERHRSQIGDSPNIMQTTSRFSSVASEISVEQSCEPRIEAATLSDSFSTLSCSLPEAPPYETDPCPEATAEDDQEISEQMAVSASAEVCEAVDEPWPAAEQLKDAEPEAISEWPRLVGKVADESLTMTQEWSAIPSEVQCEDIPEAIIESEEEEYISPCHSQAQHVLMGTGWKSCAHCFDVVRRLAGQIS